MSLFTEFYFIIFLISFIFIPIYLKSYTKQHGSHYIIYAVLTTFICLNYCMWSESTTSEGNLYAYLNIFASLISIPIVLTNIICDICHVEKKYNFYFIIVLAGIVIFSIASTPYTGLFYKNYTYNYSDNTYSYEHGIMFYFMYVYLILAFINSLYYLVSTKDKNHVSSKCFKYVCCIEVLIFSAYIIINFSNFSIDIGPLVLVLIDFVLLGLSKRIPLYDVENIVSETFDKSGEIGIIAFDNDRKLLGFNNIIHDKMPNFLDLKIDECIPKDSVYYDLFNEILDDCIDHDEDFKNVDSFFISKIIDYKNRQYSFTTNELFMNKKSIGYQVNVRDVTDRYHYLQLQDRFHEELEAQVNEKTKEILKMQEGVVLAFAELIEGRDNSTGGHIKRSSQVVEILSKELKKQNVYNVDDLFYTFVSKAAVLHDVGKITIDDAILRKKSKFEKDEFEIMKTHSEKGGEIVEKILKDINNECFVNIAKNIAWYHHEKWDGSGYPRHLKGEEIPIEARIMALADVYDALVSKRCYKDAIDFGDTVSIIMSGMGTQFDPVLKDIFEKSIPELEKYYESL